MFSIDPIRHKTIQDLPKEHPNHPLRSTSIDVSTHGHSVSTEIFRPADCGVSGTPALASHHERRMREVARLDRSGPARRRRMPRVRRGARRRGRRAATGSARALQPAAARLRGEAACLS